MGERLIRKNSERETGIGKINKRKKKIRRRKIKET